MTIAIHVENLSKRYFIRHRRQRVNDTLRDELVSLIRHLGRRSDQSECEEFWSLKDLSFEIRRGERVGIIGRNGAGKSTLLKLLSRITEPTGGRISIHGRVASLLEVGTGFHPELTGRENIYLNGAILGMRREEIRKKFDEIVAFAEVDQFLDTPVKRYSSGMYVRLAFAIAAHLEPEILIVDEVLAVGDVAFQKKCMAKMSVAGEEGTTVLFVSHNIAAIQSLCSTAMLLNEGSLIAHGAVASVVQQYHELTQQLVEMPLEQRIDRSGNGMIRFMSVTLQDAQGNEIGALHSGQYVRLLFRFTATPGKSLKNVVVAMGIDNDQGERITYLCNEMTDSAFSIVPEATAGFALEIERLPFVQGRYRYTLYCSVDGEVADWIQNAGSFSVEAGDFYGTGRLPPAASKGHFLIPHRFKLSDATSMAA
ncbi:MAG TPA: ABC transporter ATP-binding protein [Paucimonas sp.]|nr:ABC transporter ATP-binding protein [Paucimonas sp.]